MRSSTAPHLSAETCCRILIETKLAPKAVRLDQLRGHLRLLDQSPETYQRLVVLIPDETRPRAVETLADDRLCWTSFAALDQAIDELLADKMDVISERKAYLLRELQRMLTDEQLLGFTKDTVNVAARRAWADYHTVPAYICQADRSFQLVSYLGFYVDGQIPPVIPRILERHDHVRLHDRHQGRLAAVIEALRGAERPRDADEYQVFILSAPDDPQTVRLDN